MLPEGLIELNISENNCIKIPSLPSSLKVLKCRGIGLLYLPKLPEGLVELDFGGNDVNELYLLPTTLKKLVCDNNDIKLILELPP